MTSPILTASGESQPAVTLHPSFVVFNGPNQGQSVDAPADATPGTACALPWRTVERKTKYAVYVLVEWQGTKGLMHVKNYDRPEHAQAKVDRLTSVLVGMVS